MKQVYHTYLSIIKKNCTDSECKIVVPKEEYSELWNTMACRVINVIKED